MMGEAAGIAGDRRRNPFPSMNDTEYELFIYTIEKAVSTGVKTAMSEYRKENCEGHIERTIALETSVFGRREKGIVGLDEQVAENAAAIGTLRKLGWILIGAVASATAIGIADLLINLSLHHIG